MDKGCVLGWAGGEVPGQSDKGHEFVRGRGQKELPWTANCRAISLLMPPEGGAGGEGSEGVPVGWNGPQ